MFRGFGDRVAIGPELLFSGADLCSGAIRHPHIGMPPGKDEKNWGGLQLEVENTELEPGTEVQ